VLSTRVATVVASVIAAAMLLALALSPQAGAKAVRAACTRPAASHSTHGAHSCTARHRKGKAHPHTKSGGRRHGADSQTSTGGGQTEGPRSGGGAGKETANGGGESDAPEALCEDGIAPEAVEAGENGGEETFVCEDGSEPACANGLTPVVSGDGLQLLCEAPTEKRSS
jgi:hypothetical protein